MARIIDYSTKIKPTSGDYFLIDNESGGSKKVPADDIVMKSEVDPTLSQSGQAADAKVVGDEIADLKEDISHNGLATSIDEWKNGYRMANTGSALGEPEVSINWRYCKIGCNVGDVFYINVDTDSYTGYRAWAFTDENEKILKFADKAAEVHIKIIAPEGAAYLVLNDYALNQAWTKRSLKGIYSELAAQH